ncbi:MAG: PEP/pyruvate-binding domain-containing protein [Acidimicrobiales bacterium]
MIEHRPVPGVVAPAAVDGDGPAMVLDLTDAAATDGRKAGAKAANLALAAGAGLPVLPGFVLSTGGSVAPPELRAAWETLSDGGVRSLVVRSSSTVEDTHSSSMAGQFRSVLGVRDWDAFQAAVRDVLDSAQGPRGPQSGTTGPGAAPAPMAVLVQREVMPSVSGVLFGLDPVTGDKRHLVADAVAGSPQPLVSGVVGGERYVLSHTGRVVSTTDRSRSLLNRKRCRSLARLARQVWRVLGGPQDVE